MQISNTLYLFFIIFCFVFCFMSEFMRGSLPWTECQYTVEAKTEENNDAECFSASDKR